jgi:predicted RNase H-like nuclease (RuvC/YqgF family)
MEIPVQHILKKIEAEVQQSLKINDQQQIRDHVLSIKTLCELLLEKSPKTFVENDSPIAPTPNTVNNKNKNSFDDDEENGDSLFDF